MRTRCVEYVVLSVEVPNNIANVIMILFRRNYRFTNDFISYYTAVAFTLSRKKLKPKETKSVDYPILKVATLSCTSEPLEVKYLRCNKALL